MARPRNKFHGKGIADKRAVARRQQTEREKVLAEIKAEKGEIPVRHTPFQSTYVHHERDAWKRPPPAPILPAAPPKPVEVADLPPVRLPDVHRPPAVHDSVPRPVEFVASRPRLIEPPASLPFIEAEPAPAPPVAYAPRLLRPAMILPPVRSRTIFEYCPNCGLALRGVVLVEEGNCPDCGRCLV